MNLVRFKAGVFLLEAMNAFGTALYFHYLFFFLKHQFGFTNLQNLLVCTLNGFVYMGSAYYGGKFGQRRGYMFALNTGFVIMIATLLCTLFVKGLAAIMILMVLWTLGMCLTWPNLEALTSEKEHPKRLPGRLGIYNCIWAGMSALALFLGGAIVGPNLQWDRIFWIPAVIHLLQLGIGLWMVPAWHNLSQAPAPPDHLGHKPHPEAAHFLKLAWLANPFAYIAINAAVPLLPDLALRLHLSPKMAGFFCSIWFFARFFTFIALAFWPGWHYHFGYLLTAFIGVIGCFAGMLLLDNFWTILLVQLLFGWCLGVIYYSSLYYSMDAGTEKASHGGVHEAAIGAGIFAGPGIGAVALYAFPAWPQSSIWGVALVLVIGLGGLLVLRRGRRTATPG